MNVIKRQKNISFRSVAFADWFVEFKRYSKFAPKPSKNKLVRENAVKQAHGSCSLRVMGA